MSLNLIQAAGPQLSHAAFSEEGPWCGTSPHPFPHVGGGGSPDDGPWCGTPPQPHPHFDLASIAKSVLQTVALNPQPLPPVHEGGAAQRSAAAFDDGDQCGNGIIKLHLPPPPPPWADAAGALSHQVLNGLFGARSL